MGVTKDPYSKTNATSCLNILTVNTDSARQNNAKIVLWIKEKEKGRGLKNINFHDSHVGGRSIHYDNPRYMNKYIKSIDL